MGADEPLVLLLMIAATGVLAKWWHDDFRAARDGRLLARPLPGNSPALPRAYVIGITGALVLVGLETAGEEALGVSHEQSRITVLFALHTLAAAFLEELIFRGYLVVTGRGRAVLVTSVVAASIAFALLHPFLWSWRDGGLVFHGGTKAWWSTGAAFTGSLWFYYVRFMPANPSASLLPCIAAHAAKNLAVFAIKLAQGHVTGWW